MADVDVMLQVAGSDPSIARMLREVCGLDGGVRSLALDLMAARLRSHARASDLLNALATLRRDDVARRIAEALAEPR